MILVAQVDPAERGGGLQVIPANGLLALVQYAALYVDDA